MANDDFNWPQWWEWELELTPHLLKRMIDRGFNEVDIRHMLDEADDYRPSASEGRFVITCSFQHQDWEVVVEPDQVVQRLLVITAYSKDIQ
jgi:hypothetical protein